MRAGSVLVVLLLAGCSAPEGDPAPVGSEDVVSAAMQEAKLDQELRIGCALLDEARAPLASGRCVFGWEGFERSLEVDGGGKASVDVRPNAIVLVSGAAPGRETRSVSIRAQTAQEIELVLPLSANATSPGSATVATPILRTWTVPIAVGRGATEPLIRISPVTGSIFYSPVSSVYRSVDGGTTWKDVTPTLLIPGIASDTSIEVAPDGSVWWARTFGYLGGTLGCRSIDDAQTWTCDEVAIPGVTDRMWILGLDQDEGILQTNEGAEQNVWTRTTDGSRSYLPYATTTSSTVRNGNMVQDASGRIRQVDETELAQRILDVTEGPTVAIVDTPIPPNLALPQIASALGGLWIAGDGGEGPVVGRSMDLGATWDALPVPTVAARIAFSTIAVSSSGRAAVAFYGSDDAADPFTNQGSWSLHVATTEDVLAEEPVWSETILHTGLHRGPLCVSAACGTPVDGAANPRFAGDLMGIALDREGNAHIAYNADAEDGFSLDLYLRERVAPS